MPHESFRMNEANMEMILEMGLTLGLDDEQIRMRQLNNKNFGHPLLAKISEADPYSEAETRHLTSRNHLPDAPRNEMQWLPPKLNIEELLIKINPEFFYTQYKPFLKRTEASPLPPD